MKRFIALSKEIRLQKTTATLFNASSRGSEAIQGAGQVLDRFAASAKAFALGPKLTSHDVTRKRDLKGQ
ncbi:MULTISPECIES: hypothetical protein [unclassified Bradyrhizobium]|uniref:hypothetical protein n=1 Tax=unclassified Bradyrhizobium TaxID=2631580 RepID=UPI00339444BE